MRGLADYRVLGRIGAGGQGRTIHAFDTRLSRHVCIKLYRLDSRARRRAAEAEARALARVHGDSVCEIYDVVASGCDLALVTQYIHGCDLGRLLAVAGSLDIAQAIAIAVDLARGLASLRQAQVVHGDLKAENVMIRPDGSAVLTDFGAASLEGEDYHALSPGALSPEQLDGKPASLQSDFFALGLLLYLMVTGRHPFYVEGKLRPDLARRGFSSTSAFSDLEPKVAEALGRLLQALLAVDPDERPAGTQQLREALSEIQLALPIPEALNGEVSAALGSRETESYRPALPSRLKRPPWHDKLWRFMRGLWRAGSPTERYTAVLLATIPFVVVALNLSARGPCIAVSGPIYQAGLITIDGMPRASELREWLTRDVKTLRPNAIVLGQGAADDNVATLTVKGLRDSCIASEFIDSGITCGTTQCALTVRYQGETNSRFAQRVFDRRSTLKNLSADVRQMVEVVLPLP